MTTQRYVVVVGKDDGSSATRVFGPMNELQAARFRDGLRARHPRLPISARPCGRATYVHAAAVIGAMLR